MNPITLLSLNAKLVSLMLDTQTVMAMRLMGMVAVKTRVW